jgi:predicted transcriptional regulator
VKPQIQSFRSLIDEMKAVAEGKMVPPARASKRIFASERAYSDFLERQGTGRGKALQIDSIGAVARLFTPENRSLVQVIKSGKVHSVAELAQITKRAEANVSRTLKKFANLGLVTLEPGEGRTKVPRLTMTRFRFDVDLVTGDVWILRAERPEEECSASSRSAKQSKPGRALPTKRRASLAR